MIPYKSRAGRAIRSFIGGVIGAGAVFLLIGRSHAGEAPRPAPPAFPTGAALVKACEGRDGWSDAAPPAQIYGNTFYVGTCGITALLLVTPHGHVLIDGATREAAPGIAANIERLGFRLHDVRVIVASHEHSDHVGGLAELQRLTGAKVAALESQAPALQTGKPDPEDAFQHDAPPFAPLKVDRTLRDLDQIRVGDLVLTAYATPTHAPGSTSWTWTSCDRGACQTMTYADSATAVADEGYSFADHPARTARARAALARFRALPCGILLTPHPGASGMFPRFAGTKPLVDPLACRRYADQAEINFDARVKQTPKPAS